MAVLCKWSLKHYYTFRNACLYNTHIQYQHAPKSCFVPPWMFSVPCFWNHAPYLKTYINCARSYSQRKIKSSLELGGYAWCSSYYSWYVGWCNFLNFLFYVKFKFWCTLYQQSFPSNCLHRPARQNALHGSNRDKPYTASHGPEEPFFFFHVLWNFLNDN